MAKTPGWFWYPKDCDTDERVRAMDDREFGFYMRCLNHAWMNHGLPTDIGLLSRVLGRTEAYVKKLWVQVGPCFSEHFVAQKNEKRLVNTKQETQREELQEFSESQKSRALNRWKHRRGQMPAQYPNCTETEIPVPIRQCLPTATATAACAELSQKLEDSSGTQVKNTCSSGDERALPSDAMEPEKRAPAPKPNSGFTEWWEGYPRKVGKPAAQKAFKAAVKRHGLETVQIGTAVWVGHWTLTATKGQYIPYPATFLNRDQFMDQPPPLPIPATKDWRTAGDQQFIEGEV